MLEWLYRRINKTNKYGQLVDCGNPATLWIDCDECCGGVGGYGFKCCTCGKRLRDRPAMVRSCDDVDRLEREYWSVGRKEDSDEV